MFSSSPLKRAKRARRYGRKTAFGARKPSRTRFLHMEPLEDRRLLSLVSILGTSPPVDGGTLPAGTTYVTVNFSEPVLGGDVAQNYRLQSLGADSLLGTVDDTIVPFSVTSTGTSATLNFAALSESVYRLTVHDTITNVDGVALDGDANGFAGGDYVRDLVVIPRMFSEPLVTAADVGIHAHYIRLADFDGDGKTDVALMAYPGPVVGIRMGNGDGTFDPPTIYATGGVETSAFPLYGMVVDDFNDDGKPDLAVAADETHISVLINDGSGGFLAPVTYSSGGTLPATLAAGKLNNDEFPDIVVANNSGTVGVLFGSSDGSFDTTASYSSGGDNIHGLALADFNDDGFLDVVVSNFQLPAHIAILSGNQDGTLNGAVTYATHGLPSGVAVGFFNDDTLPDVVAGIAYDGGVDVFLAKPDGTLEAARWIATGNHTATVFAADVNKDNTIDIVATNQFDGTVTLLMGTHDGTFDLGATLGTGGSEPTGIAVHDFNNDLKQDLLIAHWGSSTLSVLFGSAAVLADPVVTIRSASFPFDIVSGGFGAGAFLQSGATDFYDGYGRLQIDGVDYGPYRNNCDIGIAAQG